MKVRSKQEILEYLDEYCNEDGYSSNAIVENLSTFCEILLDIRDILNDETKVQNVKIEQHKEE